MTDTKNSVLSGDFGKKKKEDIACSFCGTVVAEGIPVISNRKLNICGDCIRYAYDLLEDPVDEVAGSSNLKAKTPSKIVEFVNQYVVGQDEAKKTLALAIYNHYKRIQNQTFNDVELQKSNVLLIGPSGSGKTYLVQSIARFLDIPFAIADATTLSSAGFVGDDVETILQRLIQSANGDIEKAKYGIVFLDEVDKLAKKGVGSSNTKDPGGEGVQQALLKIIEGTQSRVPKTGGRKVSQDPMDVIDTTHILFICGGAFVDLNDILKKNHAKNQFGIGFSASVSDDENSSKFSVEPEDLYEYGMLPELIGRLPVICTLEELTTDTLKKILVEPKNSVIKQFAALAKMEGVELTFSEEAIAQIAQEAYERKTGARGLRSIVEAVLKDTMFQLPDMENVSNVSVVLNTDTDKIEVMIS